MIVVRDFDVRAQHVFLPSVNGIESTVAAHVPWLHHIHRPILNAPREAPLRKFLLPQRDRNPQRIGHLLALPDPIELHRLLKKSIPIFFHHPPNANRILHVIRAVRIRIQRHLIAKSLSHQRNQRLAEIRKGFPTEEAFKQGITAQGLTLEQLKSQAKTSLEVAKVIETEVNAKVAVQEPEVKGFYDQNLAQFKQGDTVHAAHILIGLPQGATPEQKAQAKTKAATVLKTVKAGGDFATLARANSSDPGSAPNGGDLGFFPKGQMTPAFEEAAFKLKPGTVSPLVETPFGFHIIKVIERRPPRTAPFDEVSAKIKEYLEQGQRGQKLEQFVEQVKAKGKVEILV